MIPVRGFIKEFWIAARQGPRLYFAPLVGAIRAIREEMSQDPDQLAVKTSSGGYVYQKGKRNR